MKAIKATPFLLALVPFIAGCDGDVKASDILDSGKEALSNLEDLDLSKLSVDDMKEKVGELTSSRASSQRSRASPASRRASFCGSLPFSGSRSPLA